MMWQVISVCFLFLCVGMMIFSMHVLRENKKLKWHGLRYEKQVEFFHLQAKEREAAFKEMHQFRHNFKNHMICLKEYVNEDNKEKIREYVDTLISDFKGAYWENKSNNMVVDAIVEYKFHAMQSKNIELRTTFSIPDELPFDETDLCVILGNILDNAIEAVWKLPVTHRWIALRMEYQAGSLFIVVKNPYGGELLMDKRGKFMTTKEEKRSHGMGIVSVERIATKYQGIVTIEKMDDTGNKIFEFRILLYK